MLAKELFHNENVLYIAILIYDKYFHYIIKSLFFLFVYFFLNIFTFARKRSAF